MAVLRAPGFMRAVHKDAAAGIRPCLPFDDENHVIVRGEEPGDLAAAESTIVHRGDDLVDGFAFDADADETRGAASGEREIAERQAACLDRDARAFEVADKIEATAERGPG